MRFLTHAMSRPPPGARPDWSLLAAMVLLGVALLLRLSGLNLDAGAMLHPDERFLVMLMGVIDWPVSLPAYLDSAASPLNPFNHDGYQFYVYGTLPLLAGKAFTEWSVWLGHFGLDIPARLLVACIDIVTLGAVFVLARDAFGRSTGLLAATLYGFSVLPIQLSHFFTVDPFLALFLTLALIQALALARAGTWRAAILLGLFWGAALACKVSAVAFLPVVLAAAWLAPQGAHGVARRALLCLAALALAALAFRLLHPYAFSGGFTLDPRFLEALRALDALGEEGAWFPPAWQWIQRDAVAYPLWNLARYGVGLPMFAAAMAGCAVWACRAVRTRAPESVLALAWLMSLFIAVVLLPAQTMRYLWPIYPVLAMAAAWFLISLLHRWQDRRWRYLPLLLVLASTLAWAVAFSAIYRAPMTRVAATEWLYANVPANATIGVERWDDALPVKLAGRDLGRFRSVQIFPTEQETPAKRERLLQHLAAVDYLVVSSQRNYASVARLPGSFPLAIRFYELLFGNLSGFERVAEFTSYPRLAGLTWPDPGAEEAFTVYDHPRVLIYRKSADFSLQRLAADLRRVVLPEPAWVPDRHGPVSTLDPVTGPGLEAGRQAQWLYLMAWLLLMFAAGAVGNVLTQRIWPATGLPGRAVLLTGVAYIAALGWRFAGWPLLAASQAAALGLAGLTLLLLWRGHVAPPRAQAASGTSWVFWSVLACFLGLRIAQPAIFWGERPMDFAILNAYLRDAPWPPVDPWYLGAPLQYHAWGQYLLAFLGRIAATPGALLYNLACATVPALAAELYFWTLHHMLGAVPGRRRIALLGTLLILFTGNLSFWVARPWLEGASFDDFWAATRVVPGTINEFPFWTALFGDLHGHFIAMIYSSMLMAGTALLYTGVQRRPSLALIAFALAGIALANAWALPVYALLCILLALPRMGRRQLAELVTIAGACVLLCLPFWTVASGRFGLHWMEEGIGLSDGLVLFGPFLGMLALWGLDYGLRRGYAHSLPWLLAAAVPLAMPGGLSGLAVSILVLVVWRLRGLRAPGTGEYAGPMALTGLLVLLGVEGFTVVDRMNTVFKYHFEAWSLLAMASALALRDVVQRARPAGIIRIIALGVLIGGLLSGLPTAAYALYAWWQNPKVAEAPAGLDGLAYLSRHEPGEAEVVAWLSQRPGRPGVLEAVGPAYGPYARIASRTGLPTLVGWEHHVWQHGHERADIRARAQAVEAAYTTLAGARALDRYALDYAVLGWLERESYGAAAGRYWAEAGWQPVFRSGECEVWRTARGIRAGQAAIRP